jgi:large subunit ribosomal protein L22
MRGPKLNEGATIAGVRSGTKATAKHVKHSAYKAREVLNLIRGLDVRRADQTLQLTDRGIATDIRKVLASAVANATDADNGAYIGDADELFVIACFADEGPTMRRFSPRARGRATRVRKRSCHITVIVARMTDERIDIVRARFEGASGGSVANRRARVERSRTRPESLKSKAAAGSTAESTDESEIEVETVDLDDVESFKESSDESDGGSSRSEAEASPDHKKESAEFAPAQWTGGVLPADDGSGPDTHLIKGNAQSMLYHTTESRYYKATKAEVWFDTEENAIAGGFSKPGSQKDAEAAASPDQQDDEGAI